jgi:hypothetical protein
VRAVRREYVFRKKIMDTQVIQRDFEAIGARVRLERPRPVFGWASGRPPAGPLSIDVRTDRHGEYFDIRVEPTAVEVDVVDVQP